MRTYNKYLVYTSTGRQLEIFAHKYTYKDGYFTFSETYDSGEAKYTIATLVNPQAVIKIIEKDNDNLSQSSSFDY